MNRSKFIRLAILALSIVIGVFFAYRYLMAPSVFDLGTPQQITIHWERKTYEVPTNSTDAEKITSAVERAFEHRSETCKCVFTSTELTKENSVVLLLPEPKEVSGMYMHQIIIPLSGPYYDEEHLVTSGTPTAVSGSKTSSISLYAVKSAVNRVVKHLQ